MDPTYDEWFFHGERSDNDTAVNPTRHVNYEAYNSNQFREQNHVGDALGDFVDDAYGVYDSVEGVGYGNHWKKYQEYKRRANEKLYPSCEDGLTTLSVMVELHNLKKDFNWSRNSMTELLKRLKRWFPKENTIPEKYSTMKQMLKDLGMKAECIHACENDCILFWKEHNNALECPRCHTSRFKTKNQGEVVKITKQPRKVLKYFPLASRLTRLYTIPWIARKMSWHSEAKPCWNYMRHPIDSAEWRSFKNKWPEFSRNGRNVWLGIATDGFNPSTTQSSSYSCWPVYTVPYNLPPSLCMKPEFQMLCLLIPGPRAPSQDIDVYLEPLVDELKRLWTEGVPAFDMDKKEHFTLRAMLLWGIHDLPAFGNLSGCVTHGYKACPICAMETESERSGNKIVYTKYRRFLNNGHPYMALKHGWYKCIEDKEPPTRLTGSTLLEKLAHIKYVPGKLPINKKRIVVDVDRDDEYFVNENGDDERPAWYKNLNSPVPNKSASLDKVTLTSTREKQSVKLLASDLTEVVAKGHLGTQKICHGRKVVEGEQVVWVEEVLDPEALLFDAPQNGHYTLSELVEGGFVIWPEYRLRYQ